jgi:hypothetical protein
MDLFSMERLSQPATLLPFAHQPDEIQILESHPFSHSRIVHFHRDQALSHPELAAIIPQIATWYGNIDTMVKAKEQCMDGHRWQAFPIVTTTLLRLYTALRWYTLWTPDTIIKGLWGNLSGLTYENIVEVSLRTLRVSKPEARGEDGIQLPLRLTYIGDGQPMYGLVRSLLADSPLYQYDFSQKDLVPLLVTDIARFHPGYTSTKDSLFAIAMVLEGNHGLHFGLQVVQEWFASHDHYCATILYEESLKELHQLQVDPTSYRPPPLHQEAELQLYDELTISTLPPGIIHSEAQGPTTEAGPAGP